MPIVFRCHYCKKKLSISRSKAGAPITCPICQRKILVPEIDQPTAANQDTKPETVNQTPEDTNEPPLAALITKEPDATSRTALATQTAQEEISKQDLATRSTVLEEDDVDGFPVREFQSDFDELDMTPMVDVTFLLLIFFMITASFNLQKTIQVPPPNPEQEGAAQSIQDLQDLEADSVIVEIDERNAIRVDYEPLSDPALLADTFMDKMRNENKNELVLEADERALHETVIQVIDAANAAGMQKIRLATRTEL